MNDLASGTLLGHYKIVRRLGRGGMGVVYEAADQKLQRHVAVKMLAHPPGEGVTRDNSAALERFWREARIASSLNHPGICTIYELNETVESPFIVMELLEGNSLEKLYRGRAMPYPKLVEMGIQLADALDAAHRKGVLHRDIKPANVFVIQSERVKLLDFGLAKFEEASDAPTAANLTSSGSSPGTVAYMSPEQARGEPLDVRSDLFSLGVVLYEMASGQHPFSGTTTAVVFDRILNYVPVAPITLNAQLPVEFENILNKSLEKDREMRCQSAAELRADLKRLQRKSTSGSVASSPAIGSPFSQMPDSGSSHPAQSSADASSSSAQLAAAGAIAPPVVRKPWRTAIAFAALVVMAAAGLAAWRFWPRTQPFATVSVNQITNIGTIENVALSADGKFLAEVKNDNDQRTIWMRNIATNTDTQILGAFSNSYIGLTFSPDANYLYFVRGTPENIQLRALYAMPVFGGTPKQLIYDIDSPVSFSPDGSRITYARWTPQRNDQYAELHIADKDGSNDQVIYRTTAVIEPPAWSPDGSRIAWIEALLNSRKAAVHWIGLASKKVSNVASPEDYFFSSRRNSTDLVWMPDNRHLLLLYYKPRTDRAQIGMLRIPSGEFHPVTNDVNSYSQLALSADGQTLATVLSNVASSIAYYKQDGGTPTSTTPLRITPTDIAWTDEDRLLFVISGIDIGSINRTTGNVQNFDVGDLQAGAWINACTDGHILFTGVPRGAVEAHLFRMNADGGELTQMTTEGLARGPFCTPDSREVYFTLRRVTRGSTSKDSAYSVASLPLAGGTPKQIASSPGNIVAATFSPDRKLWAALHVEGMKYLTAVSDLASGRQVASLPVDESAAATFAYFSPDGRTIVYPVLRNGGHTLLSQPLDGSTPKPLLDPVPESIRSFAWSPSGKQLAVVHLKSSSDVVLITDQADKKTH